MESGVLMTRTSFQLKREGSCLIRNNVLFSRGYGDTMCEGRLSNHLPEGGEMQWQQQRVRGSEIFYKYLCDICRKSV